MFEAQNRHYGYVVANYLTYDPIYERTTPYLHFCLLPLDQPVAWARLFHSGVGMDYVTQLWGTPNRASERTWMYWTTNGWATLYWTAGTRSSMPAPISPPAPPANAGSAAQPSSLAIELAQAQSVPLGTERADLLAISAPRLNRPSTTGLPRADCPAFDYSRAR